MHSLRLLENVPFVHLVTDARVLPPEPIRFSYIDPNYLDALCDGAASIGIQTSRDQLQAIVRDVVPEAAIGRRTPRACESHRPPAARRGHAARRSFAGSSCAPRWCPVGPVLK
jgi:hypothetical protein